MKPLSGLDAAFLYGETAHAPMNVIATVVVDRSDARDALDHASIVARLEARLRDLPPFRRRLVETPLAVDHPVWVEDPDFALERHVRRVRAPAPGTRTELAELVARAAATRLDRSRPLWELWVVEGLEDDRIALLIRAHHAALDGVSGAAMLLHLFDRGEAAPTSADRDTDSWHPDPEPSTAALVARALRRTPERWSERARAAWAGGRSLAGLFRSELGPEPLSRRTALPFAAAATRFNGSLSGRRGVAYARAALADVRSIRVAFGGTTNDVVMAACTASLRALLIERGEMPEAPLVAAVPISTRDASCEPGGNHLSAMLVELPVHLPDPVHQLAEVSRSASAAKRLQGVLGARTLQTLLEAGPAPLLAGALQLYARWKLAALHRPLYNVLLSNVPGPPVPLSLLGAQVEALYPHGPLIEGAGLNLTVMSYAGSIDVGVLACERAVPDPDALASGVAAGIEALAKIARREPPRLLRLVRAVA